MSGGLDRFERKTSAERNEEVAAMLTARRRRRVWRGALVATVAALIAVIAGCLMMWRTQGLKSDIADMRDDVGEILTMMTMGTANEAVAKWLPKLIDTTETWSRAFEKKRELFRGLDAEINQVQTMYRLAETSKRWRGEMENVSPMQRNDHWQKELKGQIEAEQKKWPNRTHEKGAAEWLQDFALEFWWGFRQGVCWPYDMYSRVRQMIRGGSDFDRLDVMSRFRYVLFPYRLSVFTMLRLAGIALATVAAGYLLCWAGLKLRYEWISYAGLLYFVYLLMTALFILRLEVVK